jgi:D-aminoacyl-tRNA deacylase
MYKKYLIVASKKDRAGVNITTQLSQIGKFDFYLVDEEMIYTKNIDLDKINQYDFIIFASKHQSAKGGKTLSIHAPGNWRNAEYGGEKGKVCPVSALFMKKSFEILNKNAKKYHLKDYRVTLEATHHGPLINKPCMFIEIGSTENEWVNRKAGFVIANTIKDITTNFEPSQYNEVSIGIGGPHYCPNFNKIQLNSNFAISHVIAGYALPATEEMIKEAVDKTTEDIDFVLLDWKGLTNAEERQRIISILDSLYLNYKKTSEVEK